MKTLLCVAFCLIVGASLVQSNEDLAALSAKINQLEAQLAAVEAAATRYVGVGKANLGKLNAVMNKVNPTLRKCLVMEILTPSPVPPPKMTPMTLQANLNRPELSLEQLSTKINLLEAKVNKIETMAGRFIGIGKSNIGLMHRFQQGARAAICRAHNFKCPVGYNYNRKTNSCYHEQLGRFSTFAAGQEYCHSMGGHLPRVTSQDANNVIKKQMQAGVKGGAGQLAHGAWLGLDRSENGNWQFVHPTESAIDLSTAGAFTNFMSSADTDGNNCAYLCLMSQKWMKTSCDSQIRVICERPPTH